MICRDLLGWKNSVTTRDFRTLLQTSLQFGAKMTLGLFLYLFFSGEVDWHSSTNGYLLGCWFGIWLWYPPESPFHKWVLAFQTNNSNHQWNDHWLNSTLATKIEQFLQVVPFKGFSNYACPFAFLADRLEVAPSTSVGKLSKEWQCPPESPTVPWENQPQRLTGSVCPLAMFRVSPIV